MSPERLGFNFSLIDDDDDDDDASELEKSNGELNVCIHVAVLEFGHDDDGCCENAVF